MASDLSNSIDRALAAGLADAAALKDQYKLAAPPDCPACGGVGEREVFRGDLGPDSEDVCPGCGDHGTMSTTCPECGGHYVLLADAHLPLGVPEADSAQWPDQRNRGLLQAAKQAEAAVTRYIQSKEPRNWNLLYEAQSYLRPAIKREEEWRAAVGVDLPDGAKHG